MGRVYDKGLQSVAIVALFYCFVNPLNAIERSLSLSGFLPQSVAPFIKTLIDKSGNLFLWLWCLHIVDPVEHPLDPGWARNGQWEFGAPTGRGGGEHGKPDPTTGHTGQNVFGVNLNGDYTVEVGGPYSLVTGPFDLRGYTSVRLSFWNWLNTDWADYVKNSLEMSLDGKTWLLVLHNPEREETADRAWSRWECGIGSWADDQPEVYLRWSYQVLAERAYPYSGWNIDDIQLCGKRQ